MKVVIDFEMGKVDLELLIQKLLLYVPAGKIQSCPFDFM